MQCSPTSWAPSTAYVPVNVSRRATGMKGAGADDGPDALFQEDKSLAVESYESCDYIEIRPRGKLKRKDVVFTDAIEAAVGPEP
jgi:hypothetical protein